MSTHEQRERRRLRIFRAERAVSQEDVALRLGISQAQYSKVERGTADLTPTQRRRLAKFYKVPVNVIDEAVAS